MKALLTHRTVGASMLRTLSSPAQMSTIRPLPTFDKTEELNALELAEFGKTVRNMLGFPN